MILRQVRDLGKHVRCLPADERKKVLLAQVNLEVY